MGTRKNRLTEAVLTCTTINVLSKNKKNITYFQMKIVIFTGVKNRCMLHGRVFVKSKVCCIFVAEYLPVASQCSNLTDASIFLSGTYEVGGGLERCNLSGIIIV